MQCPLLATSGHRGRWSKPTKPTLPSTCPRAAFQITFASRRRAISTADSPRRFSSTSSLASPRAGPRCAIQFGNRSARNGGGATAERDDHPSPGAGTIPRCFRHGAQSACPQPRHVSSLNRRVSRVWRPMRRLGGVLEADCTVLNFMQCARPVARGGPLAAVRAVQGRARSGGDAPIRSCPPAGGGAGQGAVGPSP